MTRTVRQLAAELGVTQERITDIARRLGLGSRAVRGRSRYLFCPDEANRIRAAVHRGRPGQPGR